MAHFRRRRPKEVSMPRNGEWSHPPLERGSYNFSSVANKRRALIANDTIDDGIEYEYDPLDTSQFPVRPKNKPKLTRQQRAVKRAQTLARHAEWREWFNNMMWRPKVEVTPKEEIDLGKEPDLIQPKRKRRR